MQELSADIRAAIADWIARNSNGNLARASENLSRAYAMGDSSAAVDVAAYLAVRMPATFAALSFVLRDVAQGVTFEPKSMLDVGAGPGTAALAAQMIWPSLKHFTLLEADARFAAAARAITAPHVPRAHIIEARLQDGIQCADLIIAGYVLAEIPQSEVAKAAMQLWAATQQTLVIVEPGTPAGFARIRLMRAALLEAGAHIIGPCAQEGACPMAGSDWCHFKTRLPRSRLHLQAKGAEVPFEDEAFAWIAVSRLKPSALTPRIIAPPKANKTGVSLRLCAHDGLAESFVAARNKQAYKLAKKWRWGERLPAAAKPGDV